MSLLIRSLFTTALLVGTLPALAVTQDTNRPVGPTLGDIARQAQQPAQQPTAQPAPRPSPVNNLPTMGDMVKQQDEQSKAAAAAAAAASCTRPKQPGKLPDGKTASDEEMRKAQLAVKAYVTESEAFNACLDRLVKSTRSRITVGEYLAIVQQYDLTYSAMQIFANRFNEQLRAFKAKEKPQP